MSFLDFPGLQYFYNKYLKPIKPHAREETIKSYTVNEQGHVPDAQLVVQLKEENESLQEEIEKLNSAFAKSNMDILWINQEGTYTFPLPIGKMAVVITYHGIYPHYSSSSGITANQLGGDEEKENVVTSVNNNQRTVSVYNKDSGATQAVILLPR